MRNIFIRYTFATSKRNNQTLLILYLIIMTYITWNNFDKESIKRAESRKRLLEGLGYSLIHSSVNCLTYKLQILNK